MTMFCNYAAFSLLDYTLTETKTIVRRQYFLTPEVITAPSAAPVSPFMPVQTITEAEANAFAEKLPAATPLAVVQAASDDVVVIEDRRYPIPQSVMNWKPLYDEEGIDFTAFPVHPGEPLVVCYSDGESKYTSCDGIRIGRNGQVDKWSRHSALKQVALCDAVLGERSEAAPLFRTPQFNVRFKITGDWVYLTAEHDDGTVIRLYQDDVGQYSAPEGCTERAFALARAIILTYAAVQHPIHIKLQERELATILLSIITKTLEV